MKRLYKDNCYVSNNARIEAGLPTFASMTSGTPPRATWCRTGSPYTSWGKSLATRVLRQASAALISVGKACSSRPMRMLSPQGSTSKSRRLIVPPLRPDHLNQVRLGGRWAGFGTDLTKPLTHRRGQSGGQDRVGRPWVLSRPGRKIRTKALGFLKISKCLSHLVHISPWAATLGLFAGAARLLGPGAPLILYGPYIEAAVATADSNLAFDASLRSRNPAWGLREVEAVVDAAARHGFRFAERRAMPANNLMLLFRKGG